MTTTSSGSARRRLPTILMTVLVSVSVSVLAACGGAGNDASGSNGASTNTSGSEEESTSSDGTSSDSDGTSSEDPSPTPSEAEEFGWSIPDDDVSPAFNEADVYNGLREGCSGGQAALDQKWHELTFPGNVLLFQAAVHACEGDRDSAQAMFDSASGDLGQPAGDGDCEVYKSLVSYLDQVPREGVTCLSGDPTEWPSNGGTICRDDPRTSEDESSTAGGDQGDCQPADTSTSTESTTGESTTEGESTEVEPTDTQSATTSTSVP